MWRASIALLCLAGLAAEDVPERAASWQAPGERFLIARLSAPAMTWADEGHPFRLSVGYGVHFEWDAAIIVEAVGSVIAVNGVETDGESFPGGTTAAGGIDVTVRWWPWANEDWNVFVDIGFGVQVTGEPYFPANGSQANATIMGGVGVSRRVSDRWWLCAEVMHLHVSNGNIFPRNAGYDGLHVVIGPVWSF